MNKTKKKCPPFHSSSFHDAQMKYEKKPYFLMPPMCALIQILTVSVYNYLAVACKQTILIDGKFSGEYSEAADHLCKYKGFPEKYKGKTSPTFFLQKRGFIMRFYSSTLGTSLLMSRRVDRHPS